MNKLCSLHPALSPALCREPTEYTPDPGSRFGGALQKLTTFSSNLTGILLPGKMNGRISPSRFNFAALLLMNSPMFTSYWLWLTIWKITLGKIRILKVLFPVFRKTALLFLNCCFELFDHSSSKNLLHTIRTLLFGDVECQLSVFLQR